MNENFKKALEYITKRKKLISKKLDKDQQSLELLGEYQSSDKQWFGWCNEFDILSYIETALNQAEENETELKELKEFVKIVLSKGIDAPLIKEYPNITYVDYNMKSRFALGNYTKAEFYLVKKVVEKC